mgnify:CR=1 FL=1
MVVKMYYFSNDHNPPHIHVIYGDYVGVLKILEMWNTQEFKVLSSII